MGPEKMVTIPPRFYCIVRNPVIRGTEGQVLLDQMGQVRLDHAEEEIRLRQDPFPLYPGEELQLGVTQLKVVPALTALRLKVSRDFLDEESKQQKHAGDEMLFEGPGTFVPRKELEVVGEVKAIVVKPNTALKLRATRPTVCRNGITRVAGEEWMERKNGAYLPGVYEEVVATFSASFLTDKKAVHVCATQSFKDRTGKKRSAGEEYLVTSKDMESFIPDVFETIIKNVDITTLSNRQFAILLNPVGADGKPQLGAKKLIKGEVSFFLQPGESLEGGIKDVHVMGDQEGIVLKIMEDTSDMPLCKNEGIYVWNRKTEEVHAITGQTYMLKEDEELWELPAIVHTLISEDRDTADDQDNNPNKEKRRKMEENDKEFDSSQMIKFQMPHNATVQIYDCHSKKTLVTFGLGFSSDPVVAETSDHVSFQLELSFNWHFDSPEYFC